MERQTFPVPALPSVAFRVAAVVAFAVVIIVIYGRSVSYGFVSWDDAMLITNNLIVRGAGTWQGLKAAFTNFDPELYIPLTFLSYQIDYLIGGTSASIYHLHNVWLHFLNTIGVAWFLYLLTGKRWAAFFAAFLFAIHPIHSEAVLWSSGRKDLLSTFYLLISLITYLYYQSSGRRWLFIVSLISFAFGLMCKVTIVGLPILLMIIDWYRVRKPLITRSVFIEKAPFLGLSIIFGLVAIFGKEDVLSQSSFITLSFLTVKSLVLTLSHLVVPVGLSVLYPYTKEVIILSPTYIIPFSILITLGALIIYSLRFTRSVFFGVIFFLVLGLPSYSNLVKGQGDLYLASDRYIYAGSIGLLFLITLLISHVRIPEDRQKIVTSLCVVVALLMGSLGFVQASVWKNSQTLFEHALSYYPNSYVAHANLANYYWSLDEREKALAEYSESLALNKHPRTLSNIASLERDQGHFEKAESLFKEALEMDPDFVQAHLGLGVLYKQIALFEQSEAEYKRTIELDPSFAEAYMNLGALYATQKRYEEAIAQYDLAAPLNPYNAQIFFNRGVAYSNSNHFAQAREEYRKAIALQPSLIPARINLALLLVERRDFEEAEEQLNEVLKYDPKQAKAKQILQYLQENGYLTK